MKDLKIDSSEVDDLAQAYMAEMVFPDCQSYPIGAASIETILPKINEAICSKGGLVEEENL